MENLFLEILEKSKNEKILLAIYTNIEETNRFIVGYVKDYDKTMVYLKSIDTQGNFDGFIYCKMEDIYEIEYDDRYLRRFELLINNKDIFEKDSEINIKHNTEEDFTITLLQAAVDSGLIVTFDINYDYSITGYIEKFDNSSCIIREITDDGDEDGFNVIRLNDIERVYIDGRVQRRIELFYKNNV